MKKQQTFALLMTSPVRTIEIVLGKFFAAQLVMLFAIALTVTYPLLLNTVAADGGDDVLDGVHDDVLLAVDEGDHRVRSRVNALDQVGVQSEHRSGESRERDHGYRPWAV